MAVQSAAKLHHKNIVAAYSAMRLGESAEDAEFLDKAAGKEERHRVRITRPYYLGATEVTRGQFRRFVQGMERGRS